MYDEGKIWLVKAHAERARGHQGLELVGKQRLLQSFALLCFGAPAVGGYREASSVQRVGQVVRGGDGEAVDDAGAVGAPEVFGDPNGALRGVVKLADACLLYTSDAADE